MNFSDILARPATWLIPTDESGIVISSRIRLARNVKDHKFHEWAGVDKSKQLWDELLPVLENLRSIGASCAAQMNELEPLTRGLLFERHLISSYMLEGIPGSGLIACSEEAISIMVNEEDHLRLQSLRPGLDLQQAWHFVDAIDTEIEENVTYAYSSRLGYLTACPTNVGTGMRASVMLHLPGLTLTGDIAAILKGLSKIWLTVRGLWGEGTESVGNMFQISNRMTLGETETDIIENLERIVREIVQHELNARQRLLQQQPAKLKDHVCRALGIMRNAYLISSEEALSLLSGLRLGVEMGIVKEITREKIDELLMKIQPAHLQQDAGHELPAAKRDMHRAQLLRTSLNMNLQEPE